jgi:hypothetical protein
MGNGESYLKKTNFWISEQLLSLRDILNFIFSGLIFNLHGLYLFILMAINIFNGDWLMLSLTRVSYFFGTSKEIRTQYFFFISKNFPLSLSWMISFLSFFLFWKQLKKIFFHSFQFCFMESANYFCTFSNSRLPFLQFQFQFQLWCFKTSERISVIKSGFVLSKYFLLERE